MMRTGLAGKGCPELVEAICALAGTAASMVVSATQKFNKYLFLNIKYCLARCVHVCNLWLICSCFWPHYAQPHAQRLGLDNVLRQYVGDVYVRAEFRD